MIGQRLVVALGFVVSVLFAPRVASADCAATCGDVCYAPEASAWFRVEVIAIPDGSSPRVRILERLGGAAEVIAAPGDEIADVYTDSPVVEGEQLILTLARFDDDSGNYPYNVARRIEGGNVICEILDREVPLGEYVDMATSPDCEAIASELDLSNTCDDTFGPGCAAAGAPTLLAALAVLGLVRRRSRTARR